MYGQAVFLADAYTYQAISSMRYDPRETFRVFRLALPGESKVSKARPAVAELSWVVRGGFFGSVHRGVGGPGSRLLRCASSRSLLHLAASRGARSALRFGRGN